MCVCACERAHSARFARTMAYNRDCGWLPRLAISLILYFENIHINTDMYPVSISSSAFFPT